MTSLFNHQGIKHGVAIAAMISVAAFYAPIINAAPIYKVIDKATGQITFTDNPRPYEQQADKQVSQTSITTNTGAHTYTSARANGNNQAPTPLSMTQSQPPAMTTSNKKASTINYQLTMTEPSEERAYRRPAQSIAITIQTQPALQAGDSVHIYLDGNEVAQGLSASIATIELLPGAHTVQAVIKNQDGRTLNQVSRTVYVIQNTQTLQNNKKIAAQLLAYERLPWHQKVLLKLRQDKGKPNMSANKPPADTPMTLEQPVIQ